MLVLTRKINERLFIGNDICIMVVSCHGNQVRLGIDAPHGCLILREEVKERIQNGESLRQNQKKSSPQTQTQGTAKQTIKRRKNQ